MKRLYLSKTDKKLTGLCGGIGEAFDLDSTLVRLAAVFLGLVTGVFPLLCTYIVGWLIVPEKASKYAVESKAQIAQ